mmetsp:Transcript_42968/g.63240  ORF Transcript_42968/g.63240 Transcript_42968/m.63240 type:complete len:209 (-) Transcript_42968:337-963(-)
MPGLSTKGVSAQDSGARLKMEVSSSGPCNFASSVKRNFTKARRERISAWQSLSAGAGRSETSADGRCAVPAPKAITEYSLPIFWPPPSAAVNWPRGSMSLSRSITIPATTVRDKLRRCSLDESSLHLQSTISATLSANSLVGSGTMLASALFAARSLASCLLRPSSLATALPHSRRSQRKLGLWSEPPTRVRVSPTLQPMLSAASRSF